MGEVEQRHRQEDGVRQPDVNEGHSDSRQADVSLRFVEFVNSAPGRTILQQYGFSAP